MNELGPILIFGSYFTGLLAIFFAQIMTIRALRELIGIHKQFNEVMAQALEVPLPKIEDNGAQPRTSVTVNKDWDENREPTD